MKRNVIALAVLLLLVAPMFTTALVQACPVKEENPNVPKPNNIIFYTGGEAIINLPTDPSLRVNYPASATMMKIDVLNSKVQFSSFGESGRLKLICHEYNSMLIRLWMIPAGSTTYSWQPFAAITTSPKGAAFESTFWTGTLLVFTNTKDWHIPNWIDTNNVKLVTDDTLQVESHGHKLFVTLADPQQIQRPAPTGPIFTIPAFTMELCKYGKSFHSSDDIVMTGWPGASGYTLKIDSLKYNANGDFTSNAWSYNSVPISEGRITISGIQTYYPPAAV
jgi:hypothetical protein